MLQNLPPEILCKVISQLPIKSIVLLRQVSKHVCRITYDRSIWAHAYRASSLARSDGPLECQTAQTLESILVRSARLELNWPPNPKIKPVRTRILPIQNERAEVSLLCERWLLVANDSKKIVCYDLDATTMSTATGLEELPYAPFYDVPEGNINIMLFKCESILPSCTRDRRGAGRSHPQPLAFLTVLLCMDDTRHHMYVRYVKQIYKIIVADNDFPTLCLLHQFEPGFNFSTTLLLGPRLLAIYDSWGLPKQAILMDVETHQLYEIPESERDFYTIVSTSTHVLVFCPYSNQLPEGASAFAGTHIEAYEIPPRSTSESPHAQVHRSESRSASTKTQLRLSHFTTQVGALSSRDGLTNLHDHHTPMITPLRDLTVDHTTGIGSITLTFTLACAYICVLRLQLHPALSPLPRETAAASNSIGTITLEPGNNIDICGDAGLDPPNQSPPIVQPAFNGYTRGMGFYFLSEGVQEHSGGELENVGMHVYALEIDDEEDPGCTRVFKEPSVWHLCGLQMEARVLAFVQHRGRVVIHPHRGALAMHILDFV
ncbi:hypothetical protein BJ138DRAFT_431214 [Hygrophoropsis aurantiaca]|uniref:Uncharacterized protein n=1 Tax=Hygrophoropsis aurantiaca TaxID=72124 RepID=A0ACB8A4B5_9AGAM|nr:hypothetical protein BJ138DRAFT_431214 [Hygrophoropsis aurantiaca]